MVAPSRPRGSRCGPSSPGAETAVRTDTDWLGWELFGNRAIRQGDWKLLYLLPKAGGKGDWELFNLKNDPAERHDLSAAQPAKRQALLALWEEYVKKNRVILSDAGPFAVNKKEE